MKINPCRATVVEKAGGTFVASSRGHNHGPAVGAQTTARIKSKLKEEAAANLFKAAPAMVNKILQEELTDAPRPSLPQPEHLARIANRVR